MTTDQQEEQAWVDTLRIRADLLITGGRTLRGDLHLQPMVSSHTGPETVEDVLARDEAFMPLTGLDGRVLLIAKAQVLAVGVLPSAEPQDPSRLSAARFHHLKVELSDNTVYSGTVPSELPSDRPRTLDLLNQRPGFIQLRTADVVRYLNRAHVRVVTPLD